MVDMLGVEPTMTPTQVCVHDYGPSFSLVVGGENNELQKEICKIWPQMDGQVTNFKHLKATGLKPAFHLEMIGIPNDRTGAQLVKKNAWLSDKVCAKCTKHRRIVEAGQHSRPSKRIERFTTPLGTYLGMDKQLRAACPALPTGTSQPKTAEAKRQQARANRPQA